MIECLILIFLLCIGSYSRGQRQKMKVFNDTIGGQEQDYGDFDR
jgi:hypothetical protein